MTYFLVDFVEFVAEKLGISPPPPYLSLLQNDDAILKGVNYASGGAGILNDTGLYFVISIEIFYSTHSIYIDVDLFVFRINVVLFINLCIADSEINI